MKRILFVDDEPRILEGLQNLLRRQRSKWAMSFVTSGAEALEVLEREPFDIVISDMRMPGMDGATLLQHVKDRYPHAARIVLSGYMESASAMRSVSVAHQFLTKPTTAEVVERIIQRTSRIQRTLDDKSLASIVGRIDELPSLPRLYRELTRVLEDEDCGTREVSAVIEQDPAMSAKLLQLVNSGFFGLGRRVTSIAAAATYVGVNTLKTLVMSLEVFKPRHSGGMGGVSLDELRRHSLAVSKLAARISKQDPKAAEDAFVAGMLHDIGTLVLASELPDHLAAAIAKSRDDDCCVHEAEMALYGISHAEIGAYLLCLWGLPHRIVEAVAHHHTPSQVDDDDDVSVLLAVAAADALVHEVQADPADGEHETDMRVFERLGLSDLSDWRAEAAAIVDGTTNLDTIAS